MSVQCVRGQLVYRLGKRHHRKFPDPGAVAVLGMIPRIVVSGIAPSAAPIARIARVLRVMYGCVICRSTNVAV